MGKDILIFSDGTGQAGGFMPDETRSNVYKLYRATRISADKNIDLCQQVAFCDAGPGSRGEVGELRHDRVSRIFNLPGQSGKRPCVPKVLGIYPGTGTLDHFIQNIALLDVYSRDQDHKKYQVSQS